MRGSDGSEACRHAAGFEGNCGQKTKSPAFESAQKNVKKHLKNQRKWPEFT